MPHVFKGILRDLRHEVGLEVEMLQVREVFDDDVWDGIETDLGHQERRHSIQRSQNVPDFVVVSIPEYIMTFSSTNSLTIEAFLCIHQRRVMLMMMRIPARLTLH